MLLRTFLIKIVTQAETAGSDKAAESVDKLGDKAADAAKETKLLTTESGKADREHKAVASSSSKAATGLSRLRDRAKQAGSALAGAAKRAGAFAGSIVAAGAAVAGVALAKTISFVGDETARLDAIAKSAQKSGLGFDGFQRLSHIATLSGAQIDNVAKGIGFLNVELDKIGRGATTGPVVEALQELGLSSKDLAGVAPEEQLARISDAMAKIPADADRSRLAFKLMSEDGKQLVPLFNSGGEAIRKMSESVGKVFSREELAAAEAYQDAIANVRKTIASLVGSVAASLAPLLTDVANGIDQWLSSNRGILDTAIPRIKAAFEQLVRSLSRIDLIGILESFAKAIQFVVDNFDILIGLLGAAKTASAFAGIAAGFTSMGLAAGAALGPIGLIAAALVALIPLALRAGNALGDVISKQHAIASAPRGGGTDLAAGLDVAPELRSKAGKQSEELLAAEAQTRRLVEEGVTGYRLSAARQREVQARGRLKETQDAIELRVAKAKADAAHAELATAAAAAQAEAEAKAEADEFGDFDAGVADLRATLGVKDGETPTGRQQARLDRAIAILAESGDLAAAKKTLETKRGGGGKGKAPAAADAAGKPDLLTQLGLTGPGSLLEGRPAPQTLTIYVSPTIKLIESMTISIAAGAPPEQAKQFRAAADQARDALASRLEDVAKLVEDMFRLRAKRLTEAYAGGSTLPGVT